MEEDPIQPVSVIRQSMRKLLSLNRRYLRDEENDTHRRQIPNISITLENIEEIANKLKTKTSVSVGELQMLKNGLIEDSKYAEVVLNTHGAMRALVRELTGTEVRKQVASAGCLCNLGLGESKSSTAVVKAAGPYLIAALDSLTTQLTVTCAWALGNLAGSGSRSSTLLASQGALYKLVALLDSPNEECKDAALYALAHFAWQMKDELKVENLTKTVQALHKLPLNIASTQFLFILSCHKDFGIGQEFLQLIVEDLPSSMLNHISKCSITCSKECTILYLVRTLSNLHNEDSFNKFLLESFLPLVSSLKVSLTKEDVVSQSLMWLLGNLYNHCNDHMFFNELLGSG